MDDGMTSTGSDTLRQSRGRLLPYYLFVSTVATASLPAGLIWLALVRDSDAVGAVQLAFLVAAVHALVVAAMLVANRRGFVRQLRGISRVQFSRWPWSRRPCMVVYRDTDAWWRTVAVVVFVPEGLIYLTAAYAVG